MVVSRSFRLLDAIHAVSDDGVHIEFLNAHQVAYMKPQRAITLDAERFIAPDGAPDGRMVSLNSPIRWHDGSELTPEDIAQLVADLHAAAVPLLSKFRFSAD